MDATNENLDECERVATAELTEAFTHEEIVEISGTMTLFQGVTLFADALPVGLYAYVAPTSRIGRRQPRSVGG